MAFGLFVRMEGVHQNPIALYDVIKYNVRHLL